jgi:hypothetical protein
MFEHIVLEPEQVELLRLVVEASRNVPRDKRRKFMVARTFGGDSLMHPGLSKNGTKTYIGDIEILSSVGLLNLSYGSNGTPNFDVTPLGFQYYEYLHQVDTEPVRAIEEVPRRYLDGAGFRNVHPIAYEKWREAERLLWSADSSKHLTAIGHHCREAMQAFATGLVKQHTLPGVDQDPAHVVARVRGVTNQERTSLGEGVADSLDALISSWGTTSDLVQRQEHGAQKEGTPLVWMDARRVVFHTGVVMFELDATLSKRG